eukprot:282522_1
MLPSLCNSVRSKRLQHIIQQLSHSNHCASLSSKRNQYRDHYKYFLEIQTRWNDNDMYGHVNNIVYYSFFDTIINEYQIKYANLRPDSDDNNAFGGYCVSSSCTYLSPLQYPQIVEVGLSVQKIGNSSVVYNVGIFVKGEQDNTIASAYGDFVHVFVDKKTNKKIAIPPSIKHALQNIFVDSSDNQR